MRRRDCDDSFGGGLKSGLSFVYCVIRVEWSARISGLATSIAQNIADTWTDEAMT